jgi:group I intron endonuclease
MKPNELIAKLKPTVKECCGVYMIYSITTERAYIGQSVNIKNRLRDHKSVLKKGKHTNTHLQHIYNKYGLDTLVFIPLEACSREELTK